MRGGTRGRVNLDQRDLGAVILQLLEAIHILANFVQRRFLAVERREQALNDYRPLAGDQQDVRKQFLERAISAIHPVQVALGPGVKLGPDLILRGEEFEALPDLRQVQPSRVGDQHDLEKWKSAERANVHDRMDRLDKIGTKRRFAVAAERDVTQLEQFLRRVAIGGQVAQAA